MAARFKSDTHPMPQAIAAELGVQARVLLFCLASATEKERAGVTHATAQHMLVRGLIDRDPTPARFRLTPLGQDALSDLLGSSVVTRRNRPKHRSRPLAPRRSR